jgi:hypothetical protein
MSPKVKRVRTQSHLVLSGVALLALSHSGLTAEPEASDNARILERVEVDYGDHSVFYNRIEAAVLRPPTARIPAAAPAPTAEEMVRAERLAAKRCVNLWISCTVFERQFTEIRLAQGGQEVVLQSTIDFNLLAQGLDLETADSYYNLFMGLGDVSREEFSGVWPTELLAEAARTGQAKWQVVSKTQPSADTLRTIQDLHRYVDTHRENLIAQRAQREAAERARGEWLKDNPPVPKDIVINYFPVRSSYAPMKGQKQSQEP